MSFELRFIHYYKLHQFITEGLLKIDINAAIKMVNYLIAADNEYAVFHTLEEKWITENRNNVVKILEMLVAENIAISNENFAFTIDEYEAIHRKVVSSANKYKYNSAILAFLPYIRPTSPLTRKDLNTIRMKAAAPYNR